ncbi:MAG: hypothetical protein AB7E55_01240 [Pigmentiphaga sp.]
MSYQPKTYRKQGGNEFVIADGGKQTVESGGEVDFEAGSDLKLAGTKVTASATEINRLKDVTPGTLAAGKVVVVDNDKKINEWDPTTLKIGGVQVTADADELNKLDGVTAGTLAAGKAVVVDDDKKIDEWDPTTLKIGGVAITATAAQINSLTRFPGTKAYQTLRIAANVADGETVVIGNDTYEIEVVNTDTTKNTANDASGAIDDVTDPVTFAMEDAAHGLVVGDLIRIDDEIMSVAGVDGANITAARAKCGTAIAAHVQNSDVYKGDGYTAGRIPVGLVADLTPAVATTRLVAAINDDGTEAVTASKISDNLVVIVADEVGAVALAVSETLAGVNNTWLGDAMVGGAAAGMKRVAKYTHTATDAEVTLGAFYIPVDFAPSAMIAQVRVAATGVIKPSWDGVLLYEAGPPAHIKVDISGASDWAAGDQITILAIE